MFVEQGLWCYFLQSKLFISFFDNGVEQIQESKINESLAFLHYNGALKTVLIKTVTPRLHSIFSGYVYTIRSPSKKKLKM